ncbi:hypothetical protein RP20_CCG015989 [Aedes albopictus]|nr:hypothetical protein RP20_CCG015989 [Aedes albopictus]
MNRKLVALFLITIALTTILARSARVRRQDMEQMKPWGEWGMKWGKEMVTTIIIPAGQEAVTIGSNSGGGESEGGEAAAS